MAQYIDPEFWLNLSQERLQQPDIVGQIMDMYQRKGDPAAQGYDPALIQPLSEEQPQQAPIAPSLNLPPLKLSPGQTMDEYAVSSTVPQGSVLTDARVGASQPPAEQSQPKDQLSGLNDYLELFQKTFGAEPEMDKKKRNQLAMVAGVNALGQALRQVVDYVGKTKHGSPIYPQQDNVTPMMLAQYDKEAQDYQQRKDRYDLQKTNSMQSALQYAYGDEKARQQYERQLDLQGRAQEFAANKAAFDAENRAALQKDKQGFDAAKLEYQRQADLDKLKTKYGYDLDLLNRRLSADAAKNAANVIEDQLKLAGDNIPVIDQKTGQSLVIPKELYWDVYQKIMNNPSGEMEKMMMQLEGADYQTSKQIIGGMIASEYRKFYEPKYDANGQFEGWMMKDDPNEQKEIPTLDIFSIPGVVDPSTPAPEWFQD